VDAVVAMVTVELPPAVTVVGLNVTLPPPGTPVVLKVTVWAVPETTAVDAVAVAEAPWVTVPEVGLSDSEKSLLTGALTVSEYVVLWVCEVPVPVTVMV
jgi:hypothetical protein